MAFFKCTKNIMMCDVTVAKVGDIVERVDDTLINKLREVKSDFDPNSIQSMLSDGTLVPVKIEEDRVNHPGHYTWLKEKCGIEVIDITRHLDFDKGNAVKYILRAGYKAEEGLSDKAKEIEDLKKAIWYLNDKIKMLEYDKA